MSASVSGMPGGQPSTTQPIAGPWLSPQLVMRKIWPNVLNDMTYSTQRILIAKEFGVARLDAQNALIGRIPCKSFLRRQPKRMGAKHPQGMEMRDHNAVALQTFEKPLDALMHHGEVFLTAARVIPRIGLVRADVLRHRAPRFIHAEPEPGADVDFLHALVGVIPVRRKSRAFAHQFHGLARAFQGARNKIEPRDVAFKPRKYFAAALGLLQSVGREGGVQLAGQAPLDIVRRFAVANDIKRNARSD